MQQLHQLVGRLASQDMSVALSTKGDIDSMMDHVNRSERRVADVANKVSTINRELAADVATTVRSLQFEDILSQLLSQTRQGLVDLQGITNESIRELHEMAKRSEEHTTELQSLMRISYAVLCLKKKQESV